MSGGRRADAVARRSARTMEAVPAGLRSFAPWVRGLIDGQAGGRQVAERRLVQVLDDAALRTRLVAAGGASVD